MVKMTGIQTDEILALLISFSMALIFAYYLLHILTKPEREAAKRKKS